MATMLDNGVRVRWLNTAGFEMVLPGGAHLLVDPWLDSSDVYPFPLEKIERADYILLSHVHFDHAQDIAAILAKFPKARLFVGDLSVDALCREQRVSLTNVYRVRPGEEYQFDDVKINVYAGRHTENARGVYRPAEFDSDVSSLDSLTGWYGSMELQNYLITAADGTRVLVWAGQTTPDQKYRFAGLRPDVACMHLSPKQDPEVFAGLVQAIGAKVVVPHHHDLTEPLLRSRPEPIIAIFMSLPPFCDFGAVPRARYCVKLSTTLVKQSNSARLCGARAVKIHQVIRLRHFCGGIVPAVKGFECSNRQSAQKSGIPVCISGMSPKICTGFRTF